MKKFILKVALLSFASQPLYVFAQESLYPSAVTPRSMDFNRFKTIVKKVRSLEQLLPLLPEDFRTNPIEIYRGNSPQKGTFTNPRIVMRTADARFLFAWTGDRRSEKYDSAEIMEFDDAAKKFNLHEVRFSKGKEPLIIENNRKDCFGCHGGNDPRPNWHNYPLWPGVYGSSDDEVFSLPFRQENPNVLEVINYEKFLTAKTEHPRYKYIVEKFIPRKGLYGSYTRNLLDEHSPLRRNAMFGIALNNLNNMRINRKMKAEPKLLPFLEYIYNLGSINNLSTNCDGLSVTNMTEVICQILHTFGLPRWRGLSASRESL